MDHAERVKRARQSGSRKKGKLKRSRKSEGEPGAVQVDPNASIVDLKSQETKDQERRERLRQEVCHSISERLQKMTVGVARRTI